ncbi:MAG: AAA family ATPase [Planctomycetota bacterium]|nr:AAA family ATPase [Planctomycetota bacterium]
MPKAEVPTNTDFMQPMLEVLREQGGTATVDVLEKLVPSRMGLSAEQKGLAHNPGKGNRTEVAYRMAWARTAMRIVGLIENSGRGEWRLTHKGHDADQIDGKQVAREANAAPGEVETEPADGSPQTYLFAWNPEKSDWTDLGEQIVRVRETGEALDTWSCGRTKNIAPGSRFFFIRLSSEPRGIIGSGATVDEPRDEPHWDPEKAARGETARFVDISFDALARVPLIRRTELDEPPYDSVKWDTQMSGIRIPDRVAEEIERRWSERVTSHERGQAPTVLTKHVLDRWRDFLDSAREDESWTRRYQLRNENRAEVLPEIRSLIQRFLDSDISLSEFRDDFDHKARNEWDLFGFKGPSGAMFLNMLAKHLPDQEETASELRRTLAIPEDERDARSKVDNLTEFLDRHIRSGISTQGELQPNRAPFFVSACWHVQGVDDWPVFYRSARKSFQSDGLLGRMVKGVDGYLEFARIFRTLAKGLELSFWDLEHLCVRMNTAPAIAAEDEGHPELEEESRQEDRVWLIAPGRGARRFDEFYRDGIVAIGWDELGDLSQYSDRDAVWKALQSLQGGHTNPFQDALACYQFAHEMEVGDVVFAKRGRREIVGYGVVTSPYRHEPERERFTQVRSVDWKKRGEWVPREKPLVTKTLTEIGKYPGLVSDIRRALELDDEKEEAEEPSAKPIPIYTMEDALEDLFLSRERVEEAIELLMYKKNLVLQGPPGVGKTYLAQRLALLLLGSRDFDRIKQVQFHQSYAYEDFIQGYRPLEGGGFGRVDGPFLQLCDQALQDLETPYVFIVDEINRGNLSKIFGELLLLIEADKRAEKWAVTLTYGRENERPFYVPKNLYILGTMNTADRSLAMVDYALRRRFAFFDLQPAFSHSAFKGMLMALGVEPELREQIVSRLSRLNDEIRLDANLGDGFTIGHSYFCQTGTSQPDERWYKRIVRTEIRPLLREYWFDSRERAEAAVARLLGDD